MRYILMLISLGTLLACGGNEAIETGEDMPRPAASTSSSAPPVASAPPAYNGESSLEERILASDVVAKVRLVSANAVSGTAAWSDNAPDETSPAAVWEFRFRVLEHLKGTSANEITAVVLVRGRSDDSEEDVNRALPTITAERDTQWDSREAIVFLKNSDVAVPNTSQAGRYFIGFHTAAATNEDGYTIASRWDRLWLPDASAGASAASSGSQRFLLETPTGRGTGATGASGSTRTISLSDMKSKIATLNTELNRGDGSDAYKECVLHTYRYKRIEHHYVESTGKDWGYASKYPKHTFASGLAAGSSVHEDEDGGGSLPDKSERLWLDGGDADLFSVKFGDPIPYDWSGDGVNDSIRYSRRIEAARPLPEGEYKFHYNNRKVFFIPCDGYTVRYEWTVTVTAPDGTLHEAFFDPVTDGSTVAADSTNGILKPASFTDANSASASLQRIEWASSTVKVKVSPHTGLAGQVVDFIELDGEVSLSLNIDDATVDAANHTLSWTVSEQPWHDGDKLMVRIHNSPATAGEP